MFIGKSPNFDGNWSRNGSRGAFGGEMVPGREKGVKKCQKTNFSIPGLRGISDTFCSFAGARFLVFFLKAFFLFPGPIKVPKGPERGPKGGPK